MQNLQHRVALKLVNPNTQKNQTSWYIYKYQEARTKMVRVYKAYINNGAQFAEKLI